MTTINVELGADPHEQDSNGRGHSHFRASAVQFDLNDDGEVVGDISTGGRWLIVTFQGGVGHWHVDMEPIVRAVAALRHA